MLTPSFFRVIRAPLVVYDQLYPLHPDVPLIRVLSNTAFTATPSSGVPSDTRSVSTQFVLRSGSWARAAKAVEVAVAVAITAAVTTRMRVRRIG